MNDEQFRDALRAAASVTRPADVRVDPAAARRAGDVRARTRTAVTTSLAFSLVILAGFGAVFFAAHRSRPTTLGSDGLPVVTASTSTSPVPSVPVGITAYWVQESPTVGVPDTLILQGNFYGSIPEVDISWGDGQHGGYDNLVACVPGRSIVTGPPASVHRPFTHVFSEPGSYIVSVTARPCAGPLATSFSFTVLPAAAVPTVASLAPVATVKPSTSPPSPPSPASPASPRPSAMPSRPAASPNPKVSSSRSANPSPSVTATARVGPPTAVSPAASSPAPTPSGGPSPSASAATH